MSRFLNALRLERLEDKSRDGRGTWRLISRLSYESDVAQDTILVPKGFVTDLASVPRVPFAYLLTAGVGHAAAVVHDFLYTSHAYPRSVADNVFYEALLVLGVPRWRAWLMWAGVRAGGFGPWNAAGAKQPRHVEAVIDALHPDGP